jgi:lipopolysaccharide export system protein LptA
MGQTQSRGTTARNVALLVAGMAALPFAISGVLSFLKHDPFAAFRDSGGKRETTAIDLDNVDIRHYRGEKLITKATAGKVQVASSRSEFRLQDVTNGLFNSENGPIQFAAKQATINSQQRTVNIDGGARVQSKDFDLTTPEVAFSDRTGVIQAPNAIAGKLYQGEVSAVGFRYNTKKKTFVIGKNKWAGKLSVNLQDGSSQTPTRWNIEGDSIKNDPVNKTLIYTNGRATDGEIIVLADLVAYNRSNDVVTATGNVRYFAPEANLTAAKVVVYRKEKRAVLTDKVRMLVKPESEQSAPATVVEIPEFKLLVADQVKADMIAAPKNDEEKKKVDELRSSDSMKKYPTQVAADSIEYWYGKGSRHAIITGNPQARQNFTSGMWRHVWTDHALYDGEKDLLTLVSGDKDVARMKNSYGDDLTAKNFVVSTKKDDEEFQGANMKGVVVSTGGDEDLDRPKKTPPTGGATSGSTPKN